MQAEQQTAHEQAVDVIGGRLRSDPSLCARVLAEALEQASELVEFWLAVRRCGGSLWHATIHWATTGACDLPASQLPRASVTRAAPHAASPALAASHRRWMWRCRGRARRPRTLGSRGPGPGAATTTPWRRCGAASTVSGPHGRPAQLTKALARFVS
jgi:hypothetical protein